MRETPACSHRRRGTADLPSDLQVVSQKKGRVGIVPAHDDPVAEHPLAQERVEHLVAEGPGNMGVVGVHSPEDKRYRGQCLRQRRMLFVHPQIQFLQIAHPCADVRDFIDRNGFPPCGAPGQQRHHGEKQSYCRERLPRSLCVQCLWPGREMTANAPNSGGLDNTTPLYLREYVKAGSPHLRTARVTGVKTKGRSFEQPFYFLSKELKAKS